jgi:hypothetical protein
MSGPDLARSLHQCAQYALIESNCGNFVRPRATKPPLLTLLALFREVLVIVFDKDGENWSYKTY